MSAISVIVDVAIVPYKLSGTLASHAVFVEANKQASNSKAH
jgi:hypothetical protein